MINLPQISQISQILAAHRHAVSTQHLYCWVGLWPQNLTKIWIKIWQEESPTERFWKILSEATILWGGSELLRHAIAQIFYGLLRLKSLINRRIQSVKSKIIVAIAALICLICCARLCRLARPRICGRYKTWESWIFLFKSGWSFPLLVYCPQVVPTYGYLEMTLSASFNHYPKFFWKKSTTSTTFVLNHLANR